MKEEKKVYAYTLDQVGEFVRTAKKVERERLLKELIEEINNKATETSEIYKMLNSTSSLNEGFLAGAGWVQELIESKLLKEE